MTSFTIFLARLSATSSLKLMLVSPILLVPLSSLAAPLEMVEKMPQNQVAIVPFAGDTTMSSIILNDLGQTELKVISRDLPQQPHSSSELAGSLPAWQNLGIAYLVIGSTRTNRGKIFTDYEVINLSTGQVIQGKQSLSADNNEKSVRYAAHMIADKVYELITDTIGDFSGRIAYVEEIEVGKNKISRLKFMDTDGENTKTITEVNGSIYSPAWSPDGSKIAYSVQRDKSYQTIYVQNVNGGGATSVTPYNGTSISPSFSPDGSKILFSGSHEGSADIYEINTAGGGLIKLTDWVSSESQPSYAPDGKSFVFVSNKAKFNMPEIYRYEFGSGRISKVSNSGYATSPKFNNDGSQIGFLNGSSTAIMDNTGKIIADLGKAGLDEGISFSPSGKRIVYAARQDGKAILVIKSLNGGASFGKAGEGIIRSPVWSATPNQ